MEDVEADIAAIRRFAGGEREALGEIASRHETAMLSLAKGLLGGSNSLAEEAVQDAWVRAIGGASTFQGKASVRTWLFRIVINRCRDLAKRENRARKKRVAKPTPQSGTPNGELNRAMRSELLSLPVEQREAVVLCVGLGLSHDAAAGVIGKPIGTIKSRVRLGLTRLRNQLGGTP